MPYHLVKQEDGYHVANESGKLKNKKGFSKAKALAWMQKLNILHSKGKLK